MDSDLAYALLLIAFGLGALVYRWYTKVTSPESDEGEKVTLKEIFELLDDPEFRKFISDLVDTLDKRDEEDAVQE